MNNIVEPELKEYFRLMKERPELFSASKLLPIETDIEKIKRFIEESNRKIGVLYKSDYNMLVTDLIRRNDGSYYVYERIIPAKKGGITAIVRYNKNFILLKQFRHAIREYQHAFVRGFGENGISEKENALKEIYEELGIGVKSCEYAGEIIADSGLSGGRTSVFICDTDEMPVKKQDEGIADFILLSEEELEEWIAAKKINDSFTLAAYSLYKTRNI